MSYRTSLSYSASYLASLSSSSSFAILFSSSSALFCRTFFIRSRNKKNIPIQFLSVYLLPYLSIFLSVYRYIIESYSIVSYYRCIIVSFCLFIFLCWYIYLCIFFVVPESSAAVAALSSFWLAVSSFSSVFSRSSSRPCQMDK